MQGYHTIYIGFTEIMHKKGPRDAIFTHELHGFKGVS